MSFVKKLRILDILPADTTRVTVDRIMEVSEYVGKKRMDFFGYGDIYEGKIRKHSSTTIIAVLSYFSRLGLLLRTKRRRFYKINEKNKNAVDYFKNLANNQIEEALDNLKNIYTNSDLFCRLRGFFEEKKLRKREELLQYFKQYEDKSISETTIDRKITFLCMLLDRLNLVYYNPKKQELLWKNGTEKKQTLLSDTFQEIKKEEIGGEKLKKIEFENNNKVILTFSSNKNMKEVLSKIIKEV